MTVEEGGAGVSVESLRALALALPGVEEGPCYGTPGFRVKGRLFLRVHEDGETLVLWTDEYERDFLMEAEPDVFFTMDHYRGHPVILVRLPLVGRDRLRGLVEDAWRRRAPPRLVAEHDRAS